MVTSQKFKRLFPHPEQDSNNGMKSSPDRQKTRILVTGQISVFYFVSMCLFLFLNFLAFHNSLNLPETVLSLGYTNKSFVCFITCFLNFWKIPITQNFQVIVSVVFCTLTMLCNHHLCADPKHFYLPQRKPIPIKQLLPIPNPPLSSLQSHIFLSIWFDLFWIFNTNGIIAICVLLCLASFT